MALMQAADRATDAHLLQAFLERRDEAAFEGLLRRHGPMVLGVCRRVLGNLHDAEDAFQATFLVLVRKAASVQPREMVGPWLYGVTLRTALKARAMNAKRRAKERRAGELPVPADGPPEELLARLDEELGRLPERYRVPVVLCELAGRSRKHCKGSVPCSARPASFAFFSAFSWQLSELRHGLDHAPAGGPLGRLRSYPPHASHPTALSARAPKRSACSGVGATLAGTASRDGWASPHPTSASFVAACCPDESSLFPLIRSLCRPL
jgi:RNA polymerase sigma factor (sigma-70 family)